MTERIAGDAGSDTPIVTEMLVIPVAGMMACCSICAGLTRHTLRATS